MSETKRERVLLRIYTEYATHLPTHVLVQIKDALWPNSDGPTVPEARLNATADAYNGGISGDEGSENAS